jgi:alpha-beta hydrolase superfamily lysophospholipase
MPTADCAKWFERAAGSGPYREAVQFAEQAVAAGAGDTALVDIDVRQPPPSPSRGRFRWTQRAASWLSWWGPDADSNNTEHFRQAKVPLLLLSGTADSYNDAARFAEIRAAATAAPAVKEIWYDDIDHGLAGVERQVADDMAAWLRQIGVLNKD